MEHVPDTQPADIVETDQARGQLSRRKALGRFAVLGIGTAAASSLLAACDSDSTNGSSNGSPSALGTDNKPKPATEATKAANKKVLDSLPFNDRSDFEDAKRGLIARPDTLTIKDAKGNVVWDLESYKTVHRRRQAGAGHRQPEPVAQRAAQHAVRPVQGAPTASTRCAATTSPTSPSSRATPAGSSFDPLISAETAKAAYDLVTEHLGKRPVVAVIYSHSHVDHYGGVRGIVDEAGRRGRQGARSSRRRTSPSTRSART